MIDKLQARIDDLERQIVKLIHENKTISRNTAYLYIHSNWNFIRWYLLKDHDHNDGESVNWERTKNVEEEIRLKLPPSLRIVQFADDPMDIAYQWRIETTVILNRHGFTFFD